METDLSKIMDAVVEVTGVSEGLIRSGSRKAEIALARSLYVYFAKELTKLSFNAIGRSINRTHATVLYTWRQVRFYLSMHDRKVMPFYEQLKNLTIMSEKKQSIEICPSERDLSNVEHLVMSGFRCPTCNGMGNVTNWGVGERDTKIETCSRCNGSGILQAAVVIEWMPDKKKNHA